MKFKPGDILLLNYDDAFKRKVKAEHEHIEIIRCYTASEKSFSSYTYCSANISGEDELERKMKVSQDYCIFIDENYVLDKSNRLKRLIDEI